MPVDKPNRDLLTELVRWDGGPNTASITDLAASVDDWDALLQLAQEHRIVPLLTERLPEIENFIPTQAAHLLKAARDRNAFHCIANTSELVTILAAFSAANIAAMPFKGISLAASIYGNAAARPAGDLDFLVFFCDLQRATSELLARGYHLNTPTKADGSPAVEKYYEYHFERPGDGMVVELRWRLELTEQQKFQRDLGMEWLWENRCSVRIAGVDVPDMSPIDKLLVLCMHGTKHQWSRLIWIHDVARLLQARRDLDWRSVTKRAKRRGLWRSLALGVSLAHRICGAEVPAAALKEFSSDRAVRDLTAAFTDILLQEPGKAPAGHIPYSVRILDPFDRFRWLLAMSFILPNERDRAMVRLPSALRPLYFLIRPIRLLFDRSGR